MDADLLSLSRSIRHACCMFLGLPAMAWRSLTESNCLGRELTQVAVSWQDLTFDSNHFKKKGQRDDFKIWQLCQEGGKWRKNSSPLKLASTLQIEAPVLHFSRAGTESQPYYYLGS